METLTASGCECESEWCVHWDWSQQTPCNTINVQSEMMDGWSFFLLPPKLKSTSHASQLFSKLNQMLVVLLTSSIQHLPSWKKIDFSLMSVSLLPCFFPWSLEEASLCYIFPQKVAGCRFVWALLSLTLLTTCSCTFSFGTGTDSSPAASNCCDEVEMSFSPLLYLPVKWRK